MKKLALLVVLVVVFALMGGVALAAETPHGPFDNNSAVCAACHRAHTSSAEYLLATPRVTGLCIGCHDGTGADTNVVDGAFITNGSELPAPGGYNHGTWGTSTFALMGGGFTNITYDGASTATTSKHMAPGTGTALTTFKLQFGKGTTGPGLVKNYLDCVDCHMPHRSSNYRMLRVKPTGYGGANLSVPATSRVASLGVIGTVAAENADYAGGVKGRRYTEDSGMFNYTITDASTPGAGEGVSKWCGIGCHDFYYRSAVRMNNGHSAGASPSMQTRVTVTIPAATVTNTITVADSSAITAGTSYINIVGITTAYLVTAKSGAAPWTLTLGANVDTTNDILAGTPVSIQGRGMEVYYNLDGAAGADPGFMHAVDVDLQYTPRNGSSGAQNLAQWLGGANANPRFDNMLPVADMSNDMDYDTNDIITCLTCHRAHGSDAPMAGDSVLPARNYGNTDPSGFPAGSNSMLLRLENRAICQQCHEMPTGF